ncbi:MAG TPA: NfeD family protein [Burkholderiaceae bacterium]
MIETNPAVAWWIITGVLIALELATGTFYLLMLSIGAVAGALAAHLGISGTAQTVTAALVGGGAAVAWHVLRTKRERVDASADRDVNLDIGQTVRVDEWAADGSATIKYRGADWQARFAGVGQPQAGRFVIRAIEGSCLMLDAA